MSEQREWALKSTFEVGPFSDVNVHVLMICDAGYRCYLTDLRVKNKGEGVRLNVMSGVSVLESIWIPGADEEVNGNCVSYGVPLRGEVGKPIVVSASNPNGKLTITGNGYCAKHVAGGKLF